MLGFLKEQRAEGEFERDLMNEDSERERENMKGKIRMDSKRKDFICGMGGVLVIRCAPAKSLSSH